MERNDYYYEPLDNIFSEKELNTTDINKTELDNKNQSSPFINFQKSKSPFQISNIKAYEDEKYLKFKNSYQNSQNNNNVKNNRKNQKRLFYNKNVGNTTPDRSFLSKSKISMNSKNNSSCKNIKRKYSCSNGNGINKSYISNISNKSNKSNINYNKRNTSPMIKYNNNFMRKDPNKESFVLNKLSQEVEHIKNYCNELQRQFDNHCIIKNEKREFDNIKKENIKLTAEVRILKDDVAELMKKFSLINNKIDSIQQENKNLKMQNKNLLNFISIMSNSSNGIRKLKSFNINQMSNNSLLNMNNQNSFSNNNESMNIINLINNNNNKNNMISNNNINNNGNKIFVELGDNNNNKLNKNTSLKSLSNNINYLNNTNYNYNNNINNINNNLGSEQIDFSISKSLSKNFEKISIQGKENYNRTLNYDNKLDYTNINTNDNTNANLQSKTQTQFHTINPISNNIGDNATDIVSLIQSNFNLTNQYRNSSNSKNKQNRYLIPKSED